MANEEKQTKNGQSKLIVERDRQNFNGEQIFENAMPIQPIPQALLTPVQPTSSTQSSSSGDSSTSSGEKSSNAEGGKIEKENK